MHRGVVQRPWRAATEIRTSLSEREFSLCYQALRLPPGGVTLPLCLLLLAVTLDRDKQSSMDAEETQVSVKLVTQLPDKFKVPEDVLVSMNVGYERYMTVACRDTIKCVAERASKAH